MTAFSTPATETLLDTIPQNVLIITLSAGSGHMQAAKAKHIHTLNKYPHAKIIQKDLLLDWTGKKVGEYFTEKWNRAQREGNVLELERLVNAQPMADKILFLPIFISLLRTIIEYDIDRIIDTQPIGTSAMIKAIRIARYLVKKPLLLEKIVTELPTEDVRHFFRPIKNLSQEERSLIRIIVGSLPLTKNEETVEHFWKTQCGMDTSKIRYEELPLRPSFMKWQKQTPQQTLLHINIPLLHPKEKLIVTTTTKKGNADIVEQEQGIFVRISPTDKVSVLMLGSNPDGKTLLQYIQHFIEVSRTKQYSTRKDLLFVFCCDLPAQDFPIQRKIQELILSQKDYPRSLTIIPLSLQEDNVIAPLFFRSDATFTKSGGLTSMELLAVCRGKMWIHKEQPLHKARWLKKVKRDHIGMPAWENGNALYLQAKKGARFINPKNFQENCREFFL